MKVKAKTKNHPTHVEVEVSIPTDLAGKQKAYGDDVVNAAAEDSLIITVQALMRRLIEKGKSQAEIQTAVSEWKPDVRTLVKQSAFEKASSSISKLTPEERAALLKQLSSAAGVTAAPRAAAAR